jgi:malonate transporter and related proteins
LAITGPIYLIMLIGALTVRFELFSKADMRVFGKLVINIALPCLLFNALSQRDIQEVVNFTYLGGYTAATLLLITFGFFWARRVVGLEAPGGAYMAMGMSSPNSSFVGFPILLLTLPAVAPMAFAMNLIIENLLVLPLLLMLAETGGNAAQSRGEIARHLARRLVTNPLILALTFGLTAALLEFRLPAPIARTVTLFAQASSALSLLVIGGTLFGLPWHGLGKRVVPVVCGKLLLHPLLVFAAFFLLAQHGFYMSPDMKQAAVLFAAMPIMSIYPILAQRHGYEGDAAAGLLVTTLASFLTLNLLVALVHAGAL